MRVFEGVGGGWARILPAKYHKQHDHKEHHLMMMARMMMMMMVITCDGIDHNLIQIYKIKQLLPTWKSLRFVHKRLSIKFELFV